MTEWSIISMIYEIVKLKGGKKKERTIQTIGYNPL